MARVEFTVTVQLGGEARLVAAHLESDPVSLDPRACVLVIGGGRYRPTTEVFPGMTASQVVMSWRGWQDNAMALHFVRSAGIEPA